MQPASEIELEALFHDVDSHNQSIRSQLRPGRDDNFMLTQSLNDAASGFCTKPLTHSQLLRATRGEPFCLISRCVITQGKQRIIDNADVDGQPELSSDPNKLVPYSPLWLAQHIAVVLDLMPTDQDWPDAYRHCPKPRREALACLVAFWQQEWAMPAYQILTGLLFGLPLAVTSFNRFSRFVEAGSPGSLCRRTSMTPTSLIGPLLRDQVSAWASRVLGELLGTPLSDEKRQQMAGSGTFLGLDFDFTSARLAQKVTFFVRERLIRKVLALNFLELGMFGSRGLAGH